MSQPEKNTQSTSGSPRVASWIYEVINVLLEALKIETAFIAKGNATWRFYNGQLEHLRPVSAYLTPEGRHILRDFVKVRPEVSDRLNKHDEFLERLRSAAASAHVGLLAAAGFRQTVQQALDRFFERNPNADAPTGAHPEEKLPDVVSERVINEIERPPSHYTDSKFWTAHGAEINATLDVPELSELRKVKAEFLDYDQEMISWLEDLSFDLCEEFDVPAAPLSASLDY